MSVQTIHLATPTKFGQKIVFLATYKPFLYFGTHPIGKELRQIASAKTPGWLYKAPGALIFRRVCNFGGRLSFSGVADMDKIISTCLFLIALVLILCFKADADGQPVNCPRGVAEPVLRKTVYPRSVFKLGNDGRSGTEAVTLSRGDSLIIKNGGCEYYVLTFRFVSSRYRHKTTDLKYWFRNAVDRMREILPGIKTPIDIQKGTAKLRSYVETQRKSHKVKLGEQIIFGGDGGDRNSNDILQHVWVDRIQKLKGGRTALEISFSVGPL